VPQALRTIDEESLVASETEDEEEMNSVDFRDSDQVSSTRSVGMSLARRFNAGIRVVSQSCRVATIEFAPASGVATRREDFVRLSRP